MKVTVRTLGMEPTEAIGSHAERRVQFAIGRFGARIGAVSVRLHHGGPQGAKPKGGSGGGHSGGHQGAAGLNRPPKRI